MIINSTRSKSHLISLRFDVPDSVVDVVAASLELIVKVAEFATFLHHKGQRFSHVFLKAIQSEARLIGHDVHVFRYSFHRCA